MTSRAACRVAVLVIEPANMPSVWPILMTSPVGLESSRSARAAPRRTKLVEYPIHDMTGGGRRVCFLVFEVHRLPLECSHLVERLHLHPLDVLHRRHEPRDRLDVGGV